MWHIYDTGHKWSHLVCTAFAKGTGFPIVPPAPLLCGGVIMYGALRGLLPTLRQAQREGREWIYQDNAYFLPGKTEASYFRITRNALQVDGSGPVPSGGAERWSRLGLAIKPWRTSGAHIVVCPPGRLFGATFGFSADDWLEQTLETLRKHTDRELRVRAKMSWNDAKGADILNLRGAVKTSVPKPLADDLASAWAVVTRSSNAAVEALLAGVPIFATEPCGASAMGLSDLTQIEAPRTDGDREHWAAVLASNQWLLSELRDGTAWKMLNETA